MLDLPGGVAGVVKGLRGGEDGNSNTTVPFELSQTKDFQRAL